MNAENEELRASGMQLLPLRGIVPPASAHVQAVKPEHIRGIRILREDRVI